MRLDEIPTITRDNLSESKLKICAIGDAGGGKSNFLASMPQPIRAFSMEAGNKTLEGFMKEGRDIEIMQGNKVEMPWKAYKETFLAAASNHQIEASTLAVEGYSFLNQALIQQVGGTEGLGLQPRDWSRVLVMQRNAMQELLATDYHIVVTCHLRDVFKEEVVGTNKRGEPVKQLVFDRCAPHIDGSFKDDFVKLFDVSIEFRAATKVKIVAGERIAEEEFLGYTVPRDPSREFVKDTIGGKGGFAKLPPVVNDPTFPRLCELWGVDPGVFK